MKQQIIKNLDTINNNIERACLKAGTSPKDINIIGVTKTVEVARIEELKELGIVDFGENKAKEILEKYDKIKDAKWHFIGNLQTNKVRQIIDKVCCIQSVNSEKLLIEIDKRANQIGINMPIFLEINIANEPTKHGIKIEDIKVMLSVVERCKNISLKGLMCIAPFVEKPQENREYFRKMRNLFVDIGNKNTDNIDMEYLSMGMTNDYEVAIEEGSNMIRIGTGIFGGRKSDLEETL